MGDYSFLNRDFLLRAERDRVPRSKPQPRPPRPPRQPRQPPSVPSARGVEDDDSPDDASNRDGLPLIPPKRPTYVKRQTMETDEQSTTAVSCLWDDIILTVFVFCIGSLDIAIGVVALVDPRLATATFTALNVTVIQLAGASDRETSNLVLAEIYDIVAFGAFGELGAGIFSLIAVAYRAARWVRRQPFNGANFQSVFLITFGVGVAGFFASEGATGWVSLIDGSAIKEASDDGAAEVVARLVGRYILLVRVLTTLFAFLASLVTYRSSWAWLSE